MSKTAIALPEYLQQHKTGLAKVVPTTISLSPNVVMDLVLNSVRKNPKLATCSHESILAAAMEATRLGLRLDGVLGHAYLVPYGAEASFQLGYRGMIDLADRTGKVKSIYAQCVRQNDDFSFEYGSHKGLTHKPQLDDDSPIVAAYAVIERLSGAIDFEVWSTVRINRHKEQYAKDWQNARSPWQTAWEAMAKKTVLRQLLKMIPLSAEVTRAVMHDEYIEGEFIDVTAGSDNGQPPKPAAPPTGRRRVGRPAAAKTVAPAASPDPPPDTDQEAAWKDLTDGAVATSRDNQEQPIATEEKEDGAGDDPLARLVVLTGHNPATLCQILSSFKNDQGKIVVGRDSLDKLKDRPKWYHATLTKLSKLADEVTADPRIDVMKRAREIAGLA